MRSKKERKKLKADLLENLLVCEHFLRERRIASWLYHFLIVIRCKKNFFSNESALESFCPRILLTRAEKCVVTPSFYCYHKIRKREKKSNHEIPPSGKHSLIYFFHQHSPAFPGLLEEELSKRGHSNECGYGVRELWMGGHFVWILDALVGPSPGDNKTLPMWTHPWMGLYIGNPFIHGLACNSCPKRRRLVIHQTGSVERIQKKKKPKVQLWT